MDNMIELAASKDTATLAGDPEFKAWISSRLDKLAGLTVASSTFNHGFSVAGRKFPACTHQDDPSFRADLLANGRISVVRQDPRTGKDIASVVELTPEPEELSRLVACRVIHAALDARKDRTWQRFPAWNERLAGMRD
jgi:hypothetical protein